MPQAFDSTQQEVDPSEIAEIETPPEEEGTPDTSVLGEVADDPLAAEAEATPVIKSSKEVPPELQGLWNELQSDYTRKTQEVAEERRRLASEGQSSRQKAEVLDRMLVDPTFRTQVFAAQDATAPKRNEPPPSFYGADVSSLADDSRKQVKELAMQAVWEQVIPVFNGIVQEFRGLQQELAMKDWDTVAGSDERAKAKMQEVSAFLTENPNFLKGHSRQVRLKKALLVLSDETPAKEAPSTPTNGTRTPPQRKAAQVARPGLLAGQVKPGPRGQQSLADLLRAEMKSAGMEWSGG